MARIAIVGPDDADVADAPWQTRGEVATHSYLDKPTDPIHLHVHKMGPHSEVTFAGMPTDLSIYIWAGAVEAAATRLEAGSSAIVEHGASLPVIASGEGASLVVFRCRERGRGGRAGKHVHLLPKERVPRTEAFYGYEGSAAALHADAQCPTCTLWLHEQVYAMADKETALHSHSEDEIIFVTSGSIRVGRQTYGPGTALAVAGNAKYAFFNGPDGLGFVNFRGDASTVTSADGSRVMDEVEIWCSQLGHPQPLTLAAAQ